MKGCAIGNGLRTALDSLRIAYKETGQNVGKGNINIKCPFCSDDPSYHMGINQEKGVYGCWRDTRHRGRDVIGLLSKAAGVQVEKVEEVWPNNAWAKRERSLNGGVKVEDEGEGKGYLREERVRGCPGLRELSFEKDLGTKHLRYFADRMRLDEWNAIKLARRYGVGYCEGDTLVGRIIFPILDSQGEIVGYTGRHIVDGEKGRIRYKVLQGSRQGIFPYPMMGARTLIIVEGPMDSLYLQMQLRAGITVICLFGCCISSEKGRMIEGLARRFEDVIIMGDRDLKSKDFLTLSRVIPNSRMVELPEGVNDPNELSSKQVMEIV